MPGKAIMYYEKQHRNDWYKRGWFYRTFICGHWFSGQIKVERKQLSANRYHVKVRHYRECQKCGKKVFID